MDPALLSQTPTPWFIAIIDELVDNIHQSYPGVNWTNLPPPRSKIHIAQPQRLHIRASCDGSTNSNNNNSNGNNSSGNNGNSNSNSNSNNGNSNGNGSNDNKSGGGNTVLIAAVVGAVGGCLLLAGIFFFFYRRRVTRRQARPLPPAANPPAPAMANVAPVVGGDKHQPLQFQGGPIGAAPSTYTPSSFGDTSSYYNPPVSPAPPWAGAASPAPSTTLHSNPSIHHPSSYYTNSASGVSPMSSTAATSTAAPPWAVPLDPNSNPHLNPQMHSASSSVGPGPNPGSTFMAEKAQFSGYAAPSHNLPAWAVDIKPPINAAGSSTSAGPSGSGAGQPPAGPQEPPVDAMPPPAYSATASGS